ncbi:alpha/beta-hydrolase [Pholiota conissans]|uniref:Alpha/beta-hydrolase n=1 Tax=Pholiota conissans TaxID=109636 RepID=A0A9P5YWQ4_9AGAR|nr:alpha/beta-hydrolase [Pholiota conissans]
MIAILKQKLSLYRSSDELEDSGRDYGVPLADIERLVARWRDEYDWRVHERKLNDELPQFKDIHLDGFGPLGIHYVHKRSDIEGAIPLLFVHGWPGSFIEVRKILPLLTAASPEHPSFHVVALSLPGYGFSDAPRAKGFQISQYAETGHKLMLSLGYEEYVTQGGDIGFFVTRRIAKLYGGKHSKAWHTNFPRLLEPRPPSFLDSPWLYFVNLISRHTEAEKAGLERTRQFLKDGTGYFQEHSTQPQTLSYTLADSPVGLLAWIYEKLVSWSDSYPWDDDEVLTWVSIYWFSAAGPGASLRVYYEMVKAGDRAPEKTTIPMGYSHFPGEIFNVPRLWTRTPNLVFEVEHDAGGHFASYERPKELVDDLRRMFGRRGPTYNIIKGKSGF